MAEATEIAGVTSPRNPGVRQANGWTLRSAAILTTSYVASDHAKVLPGSRIALLFDWTKGSLTSLEWYVEWSYDGTTWFRAVNSATSGGVNTVTLNNQTTTAATAKFLQALDVLAPYVRVSVKGTGTVTSSSLAVEAISITE